MLFINNTSLSKAVFKVVVQRKTPFTSKEWSKAVTLLHFILFIQLLLTNGVLGDEWYDVMQYSSTSATLISQLACTVYCLWNSGSWSLNVLKLFEKHSFGAKKTWLHSNHLFFSSVVFHWTTIKFSWNPVWETGINYKRFPLII